MGEDILRGNVSIGDLRAYSRNWNLEFIEAYQNERCLWQSNHPDYSNQAARNASYDNLVQKLGEVEPNPDRNLVVRKINSLRSAFRREYRKKSQNPDYEVRLWYYDKLLFISSEKGTNSLQTGKRRLLKVDDDEFLMIDQKAIKCSDSIVMNESELEEVIEDEEESGQTVEINDGKHTKQLDPQSYKILDISSLQQTTQIDSTQSSAQHTNVQSIPTIQITKEQFPQLFNQPTYQPSVTQSQTNHSDKLHDEFDAVGLNVAAKLRNMNPHQRIIAEKLIGDVLFNAQLNSLTISSHLSS